MEKCNIKMILGNSIYNFSTQMYIEELEDIYYKSKINNLFLFVNYNNETNSFDCEVTTENFLDVICNYKISSKDSCLNYLEEFEVYQIFVLNITFRIEDGNNIDFVIGISNYSEQLKIHFNEELEQTKKLIERCAKPSDNDNNLNIGNLVKVHPEHRGICASDSINHICLFNAGQACFSAGYINYSDDFNWDNEDLVSPTFVFDLGLRGSNVRPLIVNLLENLSFFGYVIISHYDYDHINAIKYLNSEAIKYRTWYLPNPDNLCKPSILAFFNKLSSSNIKIIPDNYDNSKPIKIGNITIYKGLKPKKDRHQSTNDNSGGLIVMIKSEIDTNYEKKMLIPGDALYQDFPIDFSNEMIEYLVIPHHCCYYDVPIQNINIENIKKVFIPVSKGHIGYRHPSINHLRNYYRSGLDIYRYDYQRNFLFTKKRGYSYSCSCLDRSSIVECKYKIIQFQI